MNKWTRRAFITTGDLAGGGLLLGVSGIVFAPNRLGVVPDGDGDAPRLTTWIQIAPDNTVTVIVPHGEMGQGVHTALAMMLAEELEADWNRVRVEEAPAEGLYANGYPIRSLLFPGVPQFMERGVDFASFKLSQLLDIQTTGASSAVRGTGHLGMRQAGAAAKAMLIEAAASRWKVSSSECVAKLSHVSHTASGRSLSFGDLAAAAAVLQPPVHPILKSRDHCSIVGTPTRRLDIPSKVNGSATYAIDVALPGMLYATLAAAPVFGAKLVSVDGTAAEAILTPSFSDTGRNAESSETIFAVIGAALESGARSEVFSSGDAATTLPGAAKAIEAEYRVPFLAHATMEPMSATVRIAGGRCEVWTGVQNPLAAREVAAQACGLEPEQVTVHNQQLGGGCGRRLPGAHDYVDQAVRIAKDMSPAPVQLIWSREEDLQHDYYRPAVIGRFKGALDSAGVPTVWISQFNGMSEGGLPYAVAHGPPSLPHAGRHRHRRAGDLPSWARRGALRASGSGPTCTTGRHSPEQNAPMRYQWASRRMGLTPYEPHAVSLTVPHPERSEGSPSPRSKHAWRDPSPRSG